MRARKRAQRFWCILDLPGCHIQAGATPRSLWRKAPGRGIKVLKILEKKAGQAEVKSVGRTGSKGMIATGWQTAPPQAGYEVVSVTNSACTFSLEASLVSPIVIFIRKLAFFLDALWTQSASSLPLSVYTASRSRNLSALAVSGA